MENKIYRWVKASERLPDKQHNYHVKVEYDFEGKKGIWNTASVWNTAEKYWQHPSQYETWTGKPSKLNVIEWLEPLPEINQEEDIDEFIDEISLWSQDEDDLRARTEFRTELSSKYILIKRNNIIQ